MVRIDIGGEEEKYLREAIRSGRFASEGEAVRVALRLLREQDQDRLAELKREIAIGSEQADRRKWGPFDPHETLNRIRDRNANGSGQD